MDFLGVGVPELIVIVILALIFVGPKELPRLAQKAGKFVRDLRMMSQGFTTEWQREITAAARLEELENVKKELAETQKLLKDTGQEIRSSTKLDVLPPKAASAPAAAPANNNDAAAPPAPSAAEPSPLSSTPKVANDND